MRTYACVARRQRVLGIAALAALILLASASAQSQSQSGEAQSYPSKPIRIIVPTGAGGITDILARFIGQKLSESLGQAVLIDNRPGAGGTIGSLAVAKAAPDGYTLLWIFPSHPVNPSLYAKLPYDTIKDFAPITKVTNVDLVLMVNASVRARNVEELIALDKAKPGGMNYGAVGEGSLGHLAAVVFNRMAGVNFVHVPYRGAPQVEAALLANEVQVFFDVPITAMPQMKAGKARGLAVTSARRIAALPDLPTLAEAGLPGYEVVGSNGLLAPAGVPKEIVRKLYDEVVRILQRPDVKEWFGRQALEPVGSSPEQFAALIKSDIAKWAAVVKYAGMKVN